MAKFRFKPFLREIKDIYLEQYFQSKQLEYTTPEYKNDRERIDLINRYFEELIEELRNEIEAELSDVCDLANDSGSTLMLQFLHENESKRINEFGEAGNYHDRALWLFLNEPEIFNDSKTFQFLENLSSKHIKSVRNKVPINTIEKNKHELEKAVMGYFRLNEGRGGNCQSEIYKYKDRAVFIVYIEDYVKTDQHFKNGALTKFSRKPAFEIIYIYSPEDLSLEVAARGQRRKINDLANLFNEFILEDKVKLPESQFIYNLNKILDPDFEIPTDPDDQIEKVFLKKLRFTNKHNKVNKVTIELDDALGIEEMLSEAKHRNLHNDLSRFNISQATFRLKFPGKGNRGSVTMTSTYPDMNDLTDKETHLKAKKYIEKWNLRYEQPN